MLRVHGLWIAAALAVGCASTASDIGAPAKPAMSMDEMMAKMTELGTPGAAHKRLDPLVGKFGATATCWMEPGAPPEVSQGTSNNQWIFDGRYVQQSFEGTFAGQPFKGTGITGFDNATQKYQGIWIDSFSTGIMPVSTGMSDANGKVFTFSREYVCPIEGPKTTREVLTIVDNNRHTFEYFETAPGGKEVQKMKIEYVRAR